MKWFSLLLMPLLCCAGDVIHEREDGYVPVVARAGFMVLDTESTLVAADVQMHEGQCAVVSSHAQFVSEYGTQKMCCGWYLTVVQPNGEEYWIVRPRGENILCQNQHYINAVCVGMFKAKTDGIHRFEMRGYCGTFDLRKDGMIATCYNEIQVMIHE